MAFIKEKFEDKNIEDFMGEMAEELLPMMRFMTDLSLQSLRYELVEASDGKRSYKTYLFESPSAFDGYGQFAFSVSFDYEREDIVVSHLSGVPKPSAAFSVADIIDFLAEDFFAEFYLSAADLGFPF